MYYYYKLIDNEENKPHKARGIQGRNFYKDKWIEVRHEVFELRPYIKTLLEMQKSDKKCPELLKPKEKKSIKEPEKIVEPQHDLDSKTKKELLELAEEKNIEVDPKEKKSEIIEKITNRLG